MAKIDDNQTTISEGCKAVHQEDKNMTRSVMKKSSKSLSKI